MRTVYGIVRVIKYQYRPEWFLERIDCHWNPIRIAATHFSRSSYIKNSPIREINSAKSHNILKRHKSSDYTKFDDISYERISEETLQSLHERLEELLFDLQEGLEVHTDSDVALSTGVLTLKLGSEHGTYVINKQTPNKQIWFSSPVSGPKRYDFIDDKWIYKHDGCTLHSVLSEELSKMFKRRIDLTDCQYGGSL